MNNTTYTSTLPFQFKGFSITHILKSLTRICLFTLQLGYGLRRTLTPLFDKSGV